MKHLNEPRIDLVCRLEYSVSSPSTIGLLLLEASRVKPTDLTAGSCLLVSHCRERPSTDMNPCVRTCRVRVQGLSNLWCLVSVSRYSRKSGWEREAAFDDDHTADQPERAAPGRPRRAEEAGGLADGEAAAANGAGSTAARTSELSSSLSALSIPCQTASLSSSTEFHPFNLRLLYFFAALSAARRWFIAFNRRVDSEILRIKI